MVPPESDIVLSVVTGQGLDHLRDALVSRGTSLVPGEGEVGLAHRQREALGEACAALAMANDTTDILIQAEALRGARAALDRLTGEAGVEHLLDALFGKFCIGK